MHSFRNRATAQQKQMTIKITAISFSFHFCDTKCPTVHVTALRLQLHLNKMSWNHTTISSPSPTVNSFRQKLVAAATYRMLGSRMLLMPPSFTLIFRQRFDSVCGVVLFTFLACTHCVASPNTISPTLFSSAVI